MTTPADILREMMSAKHSVDKELTQKMDQALWNGRLDKAIDTQKAKLAAQMQNAQMQAAQMNQAYSQMAMNQIAQSGANMAGGGLGGMGIGAISGGVEMEQRAHHESQLRAMRISIREMEAHMTALTRNVEMLSGFYYWVTEVHPELAAQYKAMRDLYEAANQKDIGERNEGGV